MSRSTDDALRWLDALVGEWTTESTHPALPGTIVHVGSFEDFEDQGYTIRDALRSVDDKTWRDDLKSTYRRVNSDRTKNSWS